MNIIKFIFITFILSTILILIEPIDISYAYEQEENTIAGLGTTVIENPTIPNSASDIWKGDYVYFGTYNGAPVKYRVLDSDSEDFGSSTMLLDCDTPLWKITSFDGDTNEWINSDINIYLNTDFLEDSFSKVEQDAIAESVKLTASSTDGNAITGSDYTALNGEKVFLLDVKEVTNITYGYSDIYENVVNRTKKATAWWLRSAKTNNKVYASYVYVDGSVYNNYILNGTMYASPALNVQLDSVLFCSKVNESNDNGGTSYKLTVIDEALSIKNMGRVVREHNILTIPYIIEGQHSSEDTQAYVLVLDKEYTEGNINQANVLDYSKLDVQEASQGDVGTYSLPDSLNDKVCGSDYFLYIVAENTKDEKYTDYASVPFEIERFYSEITEVTLTDLAQPVAEIPLDTNLGFDEELIEEAQIVWLQNGSETGDVALYNSIYTAEITLTAKGDYVFADNIIAYIECCEGENIITYIKSGDDIVIGDEGKTLTLTYTFSSTEKRKIISLGMLSIPASGIFDNFYTNDTVLNSSELGKQVDVILEGDLEPVCIKMDVEWCLLNTYNENPSATNTFLWRVKIDEYPDYIFTNVQVNGEVIISNKKQDLITDTGDNDIVASDDVIYPKPSMPDKDTVNANKDSQENKIEEDLEEEELFLKDENTTSNEAEESIIGGENMEDVYVDYGHKNGKLTNSKLPNILKFSFSILSIVILVLIFRYIFFKLKKKK